MLVIEAAGAVVWRRDAKGCVSVLLVHRPRYDDWSLPKGKLEAGESHRQAARREVHEETGLVGKTLEELGEARYVDGRGRPKRVRYWAMEALGGAFEPNDEVDEVRWVPVADIGDVLSYPHDVAVVAGLAVLTHAG